MERPESDRPSPSSTLDSVGTTIALQRRMRVRKKGQAMVEYAALAVLLMLLLFALPGKLRDLMRERLAATQEIQRLPSP